MNGAIEQVVNRIRLIVGRCVIAATKYDSGELQADAELLAGEKRRGLEFAQQYGFSSRPKGDVSGIAVFIGGSRDNGVVIATHGDGDEMSQTLEEGEVCVHSPFGSKILLSKDGNVQVSVASGKKVIYTADTFTVTGNLEVDGEVSAKCSNSATKVSLSTHIHPSPAGPTSKPTPGT